ncbi:hypothetical protein NMG60_11020969 [Bertholletia excelsa]
MYWYNNSLQNIQLHYLNSIFHLIKCFKFIDTRLVNAAALASNPDVGSSMKIIQGLATSSTAIVSRLHCSVDKLLTPGKPTKASLIPSSSMVSRTSFTNSSKNTGK